MLREDFTEKVTSNLQSSGGRASLAGGRSVKALRLLCASVREEKQEPGVSGVE